MLVARLYCMQTSPNPSRKTKPETETIDTHRENNWLINDLMHFMKHTKQNKSLGAAKQPLTSPSSRPYGQPAGKGIRRTGTCRTIAVWAHPGDYIFLFE